MTESPLRETETADITAKMHTIRQYARVEEPQFRKDLPAAWELVQPRVGDIIDRLYDHMQAFEETNGLLQRGRGIERLKTMQRGHWEHLFAGDFGEEFFKRCEEIGKAHARIGVEPAWYIGSYILVLEQIFDTILASRKGRRNARKLLSTALRAVGLDMMIALSVYNRTGDLTRVREQLLAMSDSVEREMHFTIGEIFGLMKQLKETADGLSSATGEANEATSALQTAADVTSEQVDTMAAASQELEVASREIARQVGSAAKQSADAAQLASSATDTIGGLAEAAAKIGGIVDLVNDIAGQTKLLALNATIEASRAGESGRGFGIVADEVKNLATQTERAIAEISQQTQEMRQRTSNAVGAIETIRDAIASVDEMAGGISAATEQQLDATAKVGQGATDASRQTEAMRSRVETVNHASAATERSAAKVDDLSHKLVRDVDDMRNRLTVILRSSYAGDRRREERIAVSLPGRVQLGGRRYEGYTADVSRSGALLLTATEDSLGGKTGELTLDGVGTTEVTIVAVSHLGLHLKFEDCSEAFRQDLDAAIQHAQEADKGLIAICRESARQAASAFERAIEAEHITLEALFDTHYREIPDTDPRQYLTAFTELTDRLLPPIQEPVLTKDNRVVFCAAVDRNAYLPTHNAKYSHPQRPGEVDWNIAHARNRRIFDDRAGLLAARNTKAYLVQTYLRDMGGGETQVLKEVDAPIIVRGQPWGNMRLAFRP